MPRRPAVTARSGFKTATCRSERVLVGGAPALLEPSVPMSIPRMLASVIRALRVVERPASGSGTPARGGFATFTLWLACLLLVVIPTGSMRVCFGGDHVGVAVPQGDCTCHQHVDHGGPQGPCSDVDLALAPFLRLDPLATGGRGHGTTLAAAALASVRHAATQTAEVRDARPAPDAAASMPCALASSWPALDRAVRLPAFPLAAGAPAPAWLDARRTTVLLI